jgi:hypothetical protein
MLVLGLCFPAALLTRLVVVPSQATFKIRPMYQQHFKINIFSKPFVSPCFKLGSSQSENNNIPQTKT